MLRDFKCVKMMPIKDEDSMDAQNNNLSSAHSNGAINTVGMSKAEIRKVDLVTSTN